MHTIWQHKEHGKTKKTKLKNWDQNLNKSLNHGSDGEERKQWFQNKQRTVAQICTNSVCRHNFEARTEFYFIFFSHILEVSSICAELGFMTQDSISQRSPPLWEYQFLRQFPLRKKSSFTHFPAALVEGGRTLYEYQTVT